MFERITIIGLGLMGSSIARAAHDKKLAGVIVGCDRNDISLAYAGKHNIIDIAEQNPCKAVAGSQLIILATPPATLGDMAADIAPGLASDAIVMDVASVKRAAMEAIAPHLPPSVLFVPAHPIAGSEQTGIAAGRADLFAKKRVIITPEQPLSPENQKIIADFWQAMGARIEAMPAHLHDMVYGYVSHLPQLLAFAAGPLASEIPPMKSDALLQKFLRLGLSSPDLWSEIFELNKDNILNGLNNYLDVIHHIKNELLEAPADHPEEADEQLARHTLFPRIAAACLITTVMSAEKKAGFAFARYTGTGFADFTAPATQPPEGDIEHISNHYRIVAGLLNEYSEKLVQLSKTLQ